MDSSPRFFFAVALSYEDICRQCYMQDDDERNAIAEFLVFRFVSPHFHSAVCPYASASKGKSEQCQFRNAPFTVLRLQFVNAIDGECQDVHGDNGIKYNIRHNLFPLIFLFIPILVILFALADRGVS